MWAFVAPGTPVLPTSAWRSARACLHSPLASPPLGYRYQPPVFDGLAGLSLNPIFSVLVSAQPTHGCLRGNDSKTEVLAPQSQALHL